MPINPAQIAQAEQQQWQVAQDPAPQVRLIAEAHLAEDEPSALERKLAATSLGREVCADISEAVANGQAIGQVDDGDDAIRPLVRPGAEVSCLDALYQHLLDEAPVALELKFFAPGFEVRDVDAGDIRTPRPGVSTRRGRRRRA